MIHWLKHIQKAKNHNKSEQPGFIAGHLNIRITNSTEE